MDPQPLRALPDRWIEVKATEGGDWVDERFASNWIGAAKAGIARGSYHFFTLCRSGFEQAANFLRTVPDDGELPPALDLELAGNCDGRPDYDVVIREVAAFIDRIESATGDVMLLYIGDDFEARYPVRNWFDRELWHRRWYGRPNVEGWVVWQLTGMAHVEGISGDVDLNVMRSRRGNCGRALSPELLSLQRPSPEVRSPRCATTGRGVARPARHLHRGRLHCRRRQK